MDRLNLDEEQVLVRRAEVQGFYPDYPQPLQGATLKIDDDIMWIGFIPARVLWGHDHPDFFNAYSPDWFGETYINLEGIHVTDRAPLDPEETPMPIYPEPQQLMAASAEGPEASADPKESQGRRKALQHVLKQLDPEAAKRVRKLVREKRPELLTGSDLAP